MDNGKGMGEGGSGLCLIQIDTQETGGLSLYAACE